MERAYNLCVRLVEMVSCGRRRLQEVAIWKVKSYMAEKSFFISGRVSGVRLERFVYNELGEWPAKTHSAFIPDCCTEGPLFVVSVDSITVLTSALQH
jgi:hypothetical protein